MVYEIIQDDFCNSVIVTPMHNVNNSYTDIQYSTGINWVVMFYAVNREKEEKKSRKALHLKLFNGTPDFKSLTLILLRNNRRIRHEITIQDYKRLPTQIDD
uniref:Uncharacterized protein n=1 Tax=Rhizophagus irregularis (strain DAOM 181602 / DAOM 197198 / MUCL 43194) TaxID=747089 RepID=U9UUQ1_RHIID